MRSFLAASAGHDPRQALAALCRDIAERQGAPEPTWLGQPADLASGLGAGGPELLISCFEATIAAPTRKRRGAHFTPAATARGLVAATHQVGNPEAGATLCDPTVGGGAFLLAGLRHSVAEGVDVAAAAQRLWGADIDPLAVDVARSVVELEAGGPIDGIDERIAAGDSLLGEPWSSPPPFDLIIGNPPFLSQLRGAGRRTSEENDHLARLLGAPVPAYAETALLFVLRCFQLAAPEATVTMIQPQSVLSARDNGPLRVAAERLAALRGMWFSAQPVFEAGVRVCAPVFSLAPSAGRVPRWVGPDITPAEPADQPPVGVWSDLVVDLLGIPAVTLTTDDALGDRANITAGFRDEFYGVAEVTSEGTASSPHRVLTSGLIDPLLDLWGTRPAKLAGTRYAAPVVEPHALERLDPRIRRWVDARLVPKVLVATQTRVIEVVVDADGSAIPLTPVISVEPAPDDLWAVAAVLSSPPVCAWAARRTIGSALAVDAVKLAAAQLRDVPFPPDNSDFRAAVRLVAHLRGGEDRDAWEEFGRRMCKAYSVRDDEVVRWWSDRLRWHDEEGDR